MKITRDILREEWGRDPTDEEVARWDRVGKSFLETMRKPSPRPFTVTEVNANTKGRE